MAKLIRCGDRRTEAIQSELSPLLMFCNDVVWKPVAIYTTSNLFAQQMPTGSELWRATECILDCCF